MKLSEYAAQAGISVQRASQLARAGRIPATKSGGRWTVAAEAIERRPSSRPALSERSRNDLMAYFSQQTLDAAPAGYRRQRLAQRVRELRQAENPAALIREYWGQCEMPPVRDGGTALIRASLRGLDEKVAEALPRANARTILVRPEKTRRVLRDERIISGRTEEEVAREAGISRSAYRHLEKDGVSVNSNLDAVLVAKALGLSVSKVQTVRASHV